MLNKFGMPSYPPFIEPYAKGVDGLLITLQDELDRVPMFTVTEKGNMDIRRLASKASLGFPKSTTEMLDDFVVGEIDHAGKCLAFELPTSCGFHILRAVETCMKAFLYSVKGALPPMTNRNWGEYIFQLKECAHPDVVDVLRVLKTKRNPLMHPTDNLDTDEAISLLCICQAGMDVLILDVRRKVLELKFREALRLIPLSASNGRCVR